MSGIAINNKDTSNGTKYMTKNMEGFRNYLENLNII